MITYNQSELGFRDPRSFMHLAPWTLQHDFVNSSGFRFRRYKLRQVMVDGDLPPSVKKDAHDIILEFIRSRPPLKPVWTGSQTVFQHL